MKLLDVIRPKTVDSVLSAFSTTIAQLRDVAHNQTNKAHEYADQAEIFEGKADQAFSEALRADCIAAKMESMLAWPGVEEDFEIVYVSEEVAEVK